MAELVEAAERALSTHGAFDRRDGTFVATSTPFDATVSLESANGAVRFTVRMVLPTLDAVVADESVAEIVQEGWFETLERRLADVDGALRAATEPPSIEGDETDQTLTVTATFESNRPDQGADDAAALVGFIEGTYVEGIIPGYTYREPVRGLLEAAYERSYGAMED